MSWDASERARVARLESLNTQAAAAARAARSGVLSLTISSVSGLAAALAAKADLVAGLVPTSELGAGTPNSTKFLRGDQTWQVPPAGSGGAAESFVSKYKWALD